MEVVATVVLVLFVLAGLFVLGYAVLERRWRTALATRGVVVPGVVDGVTMHLGVGDRPQDRTRWYRPVVRFRGPDGAERRATTRWPSSTRIPSGTAVPVRLLPDRPSRVVLADGPGSRPPGIGRYVAVGVIAIVVGWVLSSLLRVFA